MTLLKAGLKEKVLHFGRNVVGCSGGTHPTYSLVDWRLGCSVFRSRVAGEGSI